MNDEASGLVILSGRMLRELVDMPSTIAAVRGAFIDAHKHTIEQPLRVALAQGRSLVMAAADDSGDFAVKAVTVFPQNSGSLPVVQGLVLLFDGATGSPRIVIDGLALTTLRTGAASGVATELLSPPESSVLSIIGAGGQALDQIVAVCAVRPISTLRLNSRSRQSAEQLGRRAAELFPELDISVWNTAAEAIAGADVVCTVTTATEPLFALGDLKEDVHVNAVGAHTSTAAEVPADVIEAASLVTVDSLAAAQAEAGDLIRAEAAARFFWEEAKELGGLLLERPTDRTGITVFKSVGIAAQDLAVAKLAFSRSRMSESPQA